MSLHILPWNHRVSNCQVEEQCSRWLISDVKMVSNPLSNKQYKQVTDECNPRHVHWARYPGNKVVMEKSRKCRARKRACALRTSVHEYYPAEIPVQKCTGEAEKNQVPQLSQWSVRCFEFLEFGIGETSAIQMKSVSCRGDVILRAPLCGFGFFTSFRFISSTQAWMLWHYDPWGLEMHQTVAHHHICWLRNRVITL